MNNLELLHAIVWDFRDEMEGVWPCPNKYDSIRFAVTEAAEAIDADLRENSEYARNHAKDMSKEMELGQCLLMILTALGDELPECAYEETHVPIGIIDSVSIFCNEALFLRATGRLQSSDQALLVAAYQIIDILGDAEAVLVQVIDKLRTKHGMTCVYCGEVITLNELNKIKEEFEKIWEEEIE